MGRGGAGVDRVCSWRMAREVNVELGLALLIVYGLVFSVSAVVRFGGLFVREAGEAE